MRPKEHLKTGFPVAKLTFSSLAFIDGRKAMDFRSKGFAVRAEEIRTPADKARGDATARLVP